MILINSKIGDFSSRSVCGKSLIIDLLGIFFVMIFIFNLDDFIGNVLEIIGTFIFGMYIL
jgi:hypothetical protein